MNKTSGTDFPVEKPEKDQNLAYFCPFVNISSKVCPKGLCMFWSHGRKDCRWNIWLRGEITENDLKNPTKY